MILQHSALPENIKSSTITQETIRRLSNTCKQTTQARVNQILEEFINSLVKSGYTIFEIRKYLTAGIVWYERRVERENSGGILVHRTGASRRKTKSSHGVVGPTI